MEETKELGTQRIYKLLLKYSIPAIVGMLINAIYNMVDRIFIGNSSDVGSLGIGALSITFPIYVVIMGVAVLFGTGGSILFSTYLGEKREQEARKVLGTSTSLLIISAVVMTILGLIFADPVIRLLGASEQLFEYSKQYISIILIGAIFQNLSLGLNNFVRADGHPKTSMTTMLLGAIINIILDPIFIYGFHWGMYGAALATIIGQMCSSIWVIAHFRGNNCTFKLEAKYMKIDKHIAKRIFTLGISAFIVQVAGSLVSIVINRSLIVHGGDIAVSGMGIINSISTILILPVLGLVQGAQPIIAYNNGAKNKIRIVNTVKLCMIIATIIMIIGFIVINLFSVQLTRAFNSEPELLDFTSNGLKVWFMALPIIGLQIVGANYFQSVGKFKTAILLNMTRQILYLIPLVIILSNIWGIDGLLHAGPASDTLAFLTTMSFVIYEYHKHYKGLLNKKETECIEA